MTTETTLARISDAGIYLRVSYGARPLYGVGFSPSALAPFRWFRTRDAQIAYALELVATDAALSSH